MSTDPNPGSELCSQSRAVGRTSWGFPCSGVFSDGRDIFLLEPQEGTEHGEVSGDPHPASVFPLKGTWPWGRGDTGVGDSPCNRVSSRISSSAPQAVPSQVSTALWRCVRHPQCAQCPDPTVPIPCRLHAGCRGAVRLGQLSQAAAAEEAGEWWEHGKDMGMGLGMGVQGWRHGCGVGDKGTGLRTKVWSREQGQEHRVGYRDKVLGTRAWG